MSFGERLSKLRKGNNYTQEQLADILGVTRQSVSKWESNLTYPETEKLIHLSKLYNVSIDYIIKDDIEVPQYQEVRSIAEQNKVPVSAVSGEIMIRAQDGKSVIKCFKVVSYPVSKGKGVPKFVLFGIDKVTFWGENRNFLGYYKDEDMITKEIDAILDALEHGEPTYKLKYCAKVKSSFLNIRIDE